MVNIFLCPDGLTLFFCLSSKGFQDYNIEKYLKNLYLKYHKLVVHLHVLSLDAYILIVNKSVMFNLGICDLNMIIHVYYLLRGVGFLA